MVALRLFGICLLWAVIMIGCQKIPTDPQLVNEEKTITQSTSSSNPRLSYGDSIFFLKNLPPDYIVQPVTRPNTTGYFKAIPLGLALDSASGNINVTQSETGLRYKIFYIAPNGTLLDSVKIVISGIDYRDAIYEIAATPNAYDTAFPIYNARPEISLPCGDDDEDDDGDIDDDDNACIFDETDLDGDGNDDIPGVIQDKFLINTKKGTVDLEASFHAGVFGSSSPANGVVKDFTFYYRLQDASNRALNKLTVRLYHYKKRSDIPQSLLDTLNDRNNIAIAVNNKGTTTVSGSSTGTTNSFTLTEVLENALKPKRPPIIVVVSE